MGRAPCAPECSRDRAAAELKQTLEPPAAKHTRRACTGRHSNAETARAHRLAERSVQQEHTNITYKPRCKTNSSSKIPKQRREQQGARPSSKTSDPTSRRPDPGESGRRNATSNNDLRDLALFIKWVLLSTIFLCVFTHPTALPHHVHTHIISAPPKYHYPPLPPILYTIRVCSPLCTPQNTHYSLKSINHHLLIPLQTTSAPPSTTPPSPSPSPPSPTPHHTHSGKQNKLHLPHNQ